MRTSRKTLALLSIAAALISAVVVFAADKKSKQTKPAQMDEDKKIQHALNRFTFGPRPGDVEAVRAMGLDKWFEQQLHPDSIDDSQMEARLTPFLTLKMSTREMMENFPDGQMVRQLENGRGSMPSDPAKRAVYQSRLADYERRQQLKKEEDANTNAKPDAQAQNQNQDQSNSNNSNNNDAQMAPDQGQARRQRRAAMNADDSGPDLLGMTPDQRYQTILKMSPDERLQVTRSYKGPEAMQLLEGMTPQQRETIEAIMQPQLVVGGEISQAKILRAIYSERQLDEVMTDFWFNHFNVFIGKGQPERYMLTAYERDVIRPHVLGKFKDLLVATAKSPAMMFYLDNWQSVGPNSDLARFGGQRPRQQFGFRGPFNMPRPQNPQQAKNRPKGLNENYAREIMELHTLGVDGGYTQKDVTELAKVLTGWSIQQPQRGGDFTFNERAHEPGPKYVLGHKISENGEKEGMEMLDILAHHPSTARFISKKLAMRFVSDQPPQSLIDRMADTFMKKDGDIREVLRTMFKSPEFWAPDAYRAKVKTPLEFVASAARASGVQVTNAMPLVQTLNRMGMQLYGMQPPTGYSMKAETWVNSSALVNRMNFALQLGSGRLPGSTIDPQAVLHGSTPENADAALSVIENSILAGDVSAQTHQVIQKQLDDPKISQRRLDDPAKSPNYGAIAGLIMGSPEFQRR